MTIMDAIVHGVALLRRREWVVPDDHMELTIYRGGTIAPWATLHTPTSGPLIGGPAKQQVLVMTMDKNEDVWEPYVPAEASHG